MLSNHRVAVYTGVFDPVLVRFDTASAPRASNSEIAEELAKLAESLGG